MRHFVLVLGILVTLAQAGAPVAQGGVWWTCSAHGHGDDAWNRNFDVNGYGPGRSAAADAAIRSCQATGHGCAVTSCHPGL